MEVSGQLINEAKSCFFLDEKHERWAAGLVSAGGFQQGRLPCIKGAGLVSAERKQICFCSSEIKSLKRYTAGDIGNFPFGGRLTLIRIVLRALPIHIFQVLEPTKGALKKME